MHGALALLLLAAVAAPALVVGATADGALYQAIRAGMENNVKASGGLVAGNAAHAADEDAEDKPEKKKKKHGNKQGILLQTLCTNRFGTFANATRNLTDLTQSMYQTAARLDMDLPVCLGDAIQCSPPDETFGPIGRPLARTQRGVLTRARAVTDVAASFINLVMTDGNAPVFKAPIAQGFELIDIMDNECTISEAVDCAWAKINANCGHVGA